MKKNVLMMFFAVCLMSNVPVIAQDNTIKQTATHSVFKGLFLSVWGKLKSLNPSQKQSAKSKNVYTAGIRGAESTDTLLTPYWKGDLTQDETFQHELEEFSQAQRKLDQGNLKAAVGAFERFLDTYINSSLRPNALFAKGISLAGIGEKDLSITSMQQFVDENPNHPLVADAQQVINQLSR